MRCSPTKLKTTNRLSFLSAFKVSSRTSFFLVFCLFFFCLFESAAQTSGLVNLVLTRQTVFFEGEYPVIGKPLVISTQPAVASARVLGLGWSYILATCRACSRKILIDSCRVFLEYGKIKQAEEKLCWLQGAFRCPRCSCAWEREQ